MESYLAAAALNGVDRRSLQRSARLGQEVLERAKRRAVDWHSAELRKGSVGAVSPERPCGGRWPAAGPLGLLPGEVRAPVLGTGPFVRRRWPAGDGARAAPKHLRDLALGRSCEASGRERKSPLKTRDIWRLIVG